MSQPAASIRIDALDPDAADLWRTVTRIATALGDDSSWCLVGGLMVALFAIEAGEAARPTTDIDILGNARARPSATESVTATLKSLGAELHDVSGLDSERGFRFEIDGQVVDVLAPDGLPERSPPITTGSLQTIQIPGGTQALGRTEIVEVIVDGEPAVRLRRPTLVAAILLKARALPVHDRRDDQREDLITLLSILDDPREARDTIKKQEIRWLRDVDAKLHLDDDDLDELLGIERVRRARAAYRLLTQ
jgi:hypothetical protein